jgi:hypothetical protein
MIVTTAYKIKILFEIYQYIPYLALRIPWGFNKITVNGVRTIKLIILDLECRIIMFSLIYNSFLLVNWKTICPSVLKKKKISPMQFLGPALKGM